MEYRPKDLYGLVTKWAKMTSRYVCLSDRDTGFNRLDRTHFNEMNKGLSENIRYGVFSDYHCHRPYSANKELIDSVVKSIKDNR